MLFLCAWFLLFTDYSQWLTPPFIPLSWLGSAVGYSSCCCPSRGNEWEWLWLAWLPGAAKACWSSASSWFGWKQSWEMSCLGVVLHGLLLNRIHAVWDKQDVICSCWFPLLGRSGFESQVMGDATNKEDGEETPKKNVLVYSERLFETPVMDFILAIL